MKAGWERKSLGEVCSFENGDRGENYPSKSVQTTTGVPFINAGHLTEFGLDFEAMNYIPRERFNLLGNGKICKNDILFYDEPDFNRIIEIRERDKKRVELFMSQIDQREKTLVFCANQTHALVVRDLINQIKTSTDPNSCHRVTADDGTLGEQYLRDFQLQVFLDFVLAHYIEVGVEELDQAKLTPLLKLKYRDSIPDAVADLGQTPTEIGQAFAGFQQYLYQPKITA